MNEKQPKATEVPSYLHEETQKWFRSVISGYELEEHHIRLLCLACEAWDRVQKCRELLRQEGLFYLSKSGEPRKHPANDILRDSVIGFTRILRELDLDITAPTEAKRPPALRSIRHAS